MNSAIEKRQGTLTQAVRTEKALKVARELVRLVPALDKPEYRPLGFNYAKLAVLAEAIFAVLGEKLHQRRDRRGACLRDHLQADRRRDARARA